MLIKLKLIISFTLISLIGYAQPSVSTEPLKELSLEDAIVKRFSDFYPKGISGLTWYGDHLIKTDKENNLITMVKEQNDYPITVISLEELNHHFGQKWKSLPRISWGKEDHIYFRKDKSYYNYNLSSKKGEILLDAPTGVANVVFSREAAALAFTVDNNLFVHSANLDSVGVTQFDDPNIVAGQAIARYEMGISKGIFWSPKGKKLAFYQKDESQVTDYPLVDITSTPATLTNTKYPMAGQSSEYARVGVFNMSNQTTIYLDTDGKERDQYLTNLTWGPYGKFVYVVVVNRDQNHIWLNKYDATSGKLVKTLFEETDERYVEPENDLYFLPNNDNEFLWFSERDGFNHLYRYNTEGTLLNQVTKGDWAVLKILGVDKKGENIFIKGTDESGINQIAYKSSIKDHNSKRLNNTNGIHRYKMNASGTQFIDDYTQLNTPRKIDIITHKGKVKMELLNATNPLNQHKIGTVELINFTSDEGILLHGRIIKPSDFDPSKKYPVFVYLYGGPHAQMVTNRWLGGAPLWMLHAAERGYIVFTIDNRGSANRGNEFESCIHRKLGTIEMEDQMAGVDYLKTLPYADTKRMAIHGWSFGGFMASTLMLRSPGVFQVGVAGGPVTDWKYYEIMYGERYMDTPQDNPEGYKTADLKEYVNNLEGDLLLIHGSVDPTVVPQHSLSLIQQFVTNGVQMDFYTYPMHPHNVRGKDRVHLMRKVIDYVDDKLNVIK